MTGIIDKRLLELLVCPDDKAPLVEDQENVRLVCTQCEKYYSLTESGIPILLGPKVKGRASEPGDRE